MSRVRRFGRLRVRCGRRCERERERDIDRGKGGKGAAGEEVVLGEMVLDRSYTE